MNAIPHIAVDSRSVFDSNGKLDGSVVGPLMQLEKDGYRVSVLCTDDTTITAVSATLAHHGYHFDCVRVYSSAKQPDLVLDIEGMRRLNVTLDMQNVAQSIRSQFPIDKCENCATVCDRTRMYLVPCDQYLACSPLCVSQVMSTKPPFTKATTPQPQQVQHHSTPLPVHSAGPLPEDEVRDLPKVRSRGDVQ